MINDGNNQDSYVLADKEEDDDQPPPCLYGLF